MNLADAIRGAASFRAALSHEETMNLDPTNAPSSAPSMDPPDAPQAFAPKSEAGEYQQVPAAMAQGMGIGHLVRLELYLSPEQMKGLFAAVVGSQHSVLTTREASALLRVNPQALEKMAEEGTVPAVSIEGRWRYSKSAIEEWLSLQSMNMGGKRNVA